MMAIALQTILCMLLAFIVGAITAWVIRGIRDQNEFEKFFGTWRARYDLLERDCDEHMARASALQKQLNAPSAGHEVHDRQTKIEAQPDTSNAG
ncbi:MAG: hypothetical protein ABIP64_13840 [Burkholderiales bacterium]